ncbi:MAG: adenine deaminase C-terminal domain-containing protein, partial [Flavihumibacter sp.]
EVFKKIAAAQKQGKPVDGHAPGLRGHDARRYVAAGISTDHECFTEAEAAEKLSLGMKILVREGSAARNFDALVPLLETHAGQMMFCTDDKHPDSLVLGHINRLCARAVAYGIDVFKVLQAACINPVEHYKMNVGQLRPGDPADFVVLSDLERFLPLQTWINGQCCAENGRSLLPQTESAVINNFYSRTLSVADFRLPVSVKALPVIGALESQLITEKIHPDPADFIEQEGQLLSNPGKDLLKCFVVNRYGETPPAGCFIRHFGLQKGAIASSVAHDSHNIIVAGLDDEDICRAVNLLMASKGGLSCVSGSEEAVLPLPVGGLMSAGEGYAVAAAYTQIDTMAKSLGCTLQAPYMTLSFMALLVIPHIKLSDKGLFDGDAFRFFQ